MSKYYLYQDESKCISCRSCEVQCKVNKGLFEVGPKPNQVVAAGEIRINGEPSFIACFHCEEPWCIPVCSTGAIQKRAIDGIVFIDQELCVGCKSCIMACPWGAPQWDARKGRAVKCDYCKDRIDAGLKPACVAACPTGSLIFGPAGDVPSIIPSYSRSS
ncbi:MAG: 4Fe-4S dicluster domain-containing protein, partial [Desulfofundulus sp.]